MEYHIMVFQTLCKHFALPVIWRLVVFSLEKCVKILDPAPHPSPLPMGEGEREQIFVLFKNEFDSIFQVGV